MELVLTGRRFSAQEAFEWGIVNRVATGGAWLNEAIDLGRVVASGPPAGGEARQAGRAGRATRPA